VIDKGGLLTLPLEDSPGGFLKQMQKISEAGINIEYVYAFAAAGGREARAVLKVDDVRRAEQLVALERCEQEGGVDYYW
jgi:hypothetical protein